MKIRITETHIEADAKELAASRNLSETFIAGLNRAFGRVASWPEDDEEVEEDDSDE